MNYVSKTNSMKLLAAGGLALAMMGAGLASARPEGAPPGGAHHEARQGAAPERMLEHMSERLELTEKQREAIGKLMESEREMAMKDRKQMSELRDSLRDAAGDAYDEAAVERTAARLGELTARMSLQRVKTRHEIRELLTPEQQKKLDSFEARRGERPHHKGKDRGRH